MSEFGASIVASLRYILSLEVILYLIGFVVVAWSLLFLCNLNYFFAYASGGEDGLSAVAILLSLLWVVWLWLFYGYVNYCLEVLEVAIQSEARVCLGVRHFTSLQLSWPLAIGVIILASISVVDIADIDRSYLLVLLVLLPASFTAYAISRNIIEAINPIFLWAAIKRFGVYYLFPLMVIFCLSFLEIDLFSQSVNATVGQLMLVFMSGIFISKYLGGVIQAKHVEFGLALLKSDRLNAERNRAVEDVFQRVYLLSRANKRHQSVDLIDSELAGFYGGDESLFEDLATRTDNALIFLWAERYLFRLISASEFKQMWRFIAVLVCRHPDFTIHSPVVKNILLQQGLLPEQKLMLGKLLGRDLT